MELGGKVVIVTGASSGIGESAARLFAARGAKVVLGGRRQSALEDVVCAIVASGGEARHLAGDVREAAYAEAAAFLISDRASFVTGSALYADGGNSILKA